MDQFDVNVYVGFYALGVALAFLFNVVVFVAIVIVIIKHPTLRASSLPKFLTVLVCSLAQLTIAAWAKAPYLHYMRSTSQWDMSCTASLARYIGGWRILPSFSMLTVAVAILTEVMLLVKMSQTRRMVITISLLMIAAVYSLVTTLTINYLKILQYPEKPCDVDGPPFEVNASGYWDRIDMAVVYAPPAVVIFMSNLLLVIARVITRRKSSTENQVPSEKGPPISLLEETINGCDTAVLRATSITDNNATSVAIFSEQPPLAIDLFLAGIVTIVLNFPKFYSSVIWKDANLDPEYLDPEYLTQTDLKFILGADFVSMFSLALVPCCWLLGREIRVFVRNTIIRRARAGPVANNYNEITSEN